MIKHGGTILLCLVFQMVFAQNYTSRLFSVDDGLPDNYVYSTIQDEEGFLWVSTGKGLCRFDGQVFQSYPLEGGEENNIVYAGALDRNKDLWFGTFDGKIYKLDKAKNKLKLYPGKIEGSVNKIVASELPSRLYFLSKGKGIYILENNRLERIKNTDNYEIKDVVETDKTSLLLATTEGLLLIDLRSLRIIPLPGLNFQVNQIQKLKTLPGRYFISSAEKGFFQVYLRDTVSIIEEHIHEKNFPAISFFFLEEFRDELFVTCKDETFAVYNIKNKSLQKLDEDYFRANAASIFIDREFNIWVGTVGVGLYYLYRTSFDFIYVNNEPVFAMVQDKNKNSYYGTNNGIFIYDAAGRPVKKVTRIGSKEMGKVNALYLDKQDKLWIGTSENGLIVCNRENLAAIEIEFTDVHPISVNAITASSIDEEIQVCTNLAGVFSYKAGKQIRHLSVENGLLHNNVYYALKSKQGNIYYATHNTGFSFLKDEKIYEIEIKDKKLSTDFNCFAEDKDGNVMIGTNGGGIYILRGQQVKAFGRNSEFESRYCKGLLFDKEENLWCILGEDLYKYYPKQNVLKKIIFEVNTRRSADLNSFYLNEEGDVFMCTGKYVVASKSVPGSRSSTYPARSYIMQVRVNDSLIKPDALLELTNGKYSLKFEYSALALKNSAQVAFRYMLEGRDAGWSEITRTRHVEFPNITEGEYTFKVLAINSEGFEESTPSFFKFTVRPPFWKSAWFWTFGLAALVLIFILIIRFRTASLTKAKIKLEQIVEEKTKELREEKRQVEENNKIIEGQNQEIKDSILYAKRIQDAMLPDKKIITDRSDRLFVFYQPRDIVSGDFYWLGEVNSIKIVVVADCTGHGVPGAFMSMIGNTLLNKIIIERKITKAADILNELDKEVRRALKQYSKESTKDGMDVALCCIDDDHKKIFYCGALRPLIHIRRKSMTVYSPNKHSIGGFNYGEVREFRQTEIDMEEGDMFYMFSDGYADQFGGENGKKFMLKNFKQLLISISSEEMYKQEDILGKSYNSWKGRQDQVDDVLVIGMRM